jgi:hypothetical protein
MGIVVKLVHLLHLNRFLIFDKECHLEDRKTQLLAVGADVKKLRVTVGIEIFEGANFLTGSAE